MLFFRHQYGISRLECFMISNMNETLKKFVLRLSQLFDSFRNCCNIMLPARLGTAVPLRLSELCVPRGASRGGCWSPPTPLCKPRTSILSSLYNRTNYGRPAFSYAGPHALNKFTSWKYVDVNIYSHLQALSKYIVIRADYAFSVLETFFV